MFKSLVISLMTVVTFTSLSGVIFLKNQVFLEDSVSALLYIMVERMFQQILSHCSVEKLSV